MKKKAFRILIIILLCVLIGALALGFLLPRLRGQEEAIPREDQIYRNGDYIGYLTIARQLPAGSTQEAMEAAAEGIHVFMRRENPEIWAMAQSHLKNIKRYKLFGIPFFSVEQSRKETKFLLFCIIPIFTIRRHLPVIIGM